MNSSIKNNFSIICILKLEMHLFLYIYIITVLSDFYPSNKLHVFYICSVPTNIFILCDITRTSITYINVGRFSYD